MKADIITIGDEILIGQIVDTNSAWMAQRLGEIGLSVRRKYSIGDRREEIVAAVEDSLAASEVVLITGGLGPTKDDITKKVLAEIFHSTLVRHEETYARVERMMTARGIEFNALNQGQALVPECCTVLPNHKGTAPGMWFEREGRVVVSLPGVPFEMEALMTESVLPRLRSHFNLQSVVHRTAITYGLAESMLAERIAPWEDALPDYLHLAYLPSPSQLRLRLSAYDVDAEQATQEIDAQFEALMPLLGDYFVGWESDTLQSVVAEMLTARGETLAAAESCTGGALSAKFTAMSGASEYFWGAVVSYDNSVKENVLGVSHSDLEQYGAVSEQVARQMAEGVRRVCSTTYGVATTGIAGPTGGSADKPVGTVWTAVAGPQGTVAQMKVHGRLRAQNIDRAASAAINLLRLYIKKIG
ncbi:MAG: competence/damage-inducible protein A [Tidjanibacter sp.]|nr:competence/damage-inducible protein A [Tidjanibacter sp.]